VDVCAAASQRERRSREAAAQPGALSWFLGLFKSNSRNGGYQEIPMDGNREIPRKIPVKIEPKVFFANERTFLAWLHMAVTLASISIAIIA
jgi:hypothetical protein